jgi:hypothetical protein
MRYMQVIRRTVIPALLVVAAGTVGVQRAHARAGQSTCVFDHYAPVAAVPYSYDANVAYGSYSFLRGVQLYVPASQGLTREWLEASVQRALREVNSPAALDIGASALHCGTNAPRVQHVNASVRSAGNGFWVYLIARDESSAKSLVNWAQDLVGRGKPNYKSNYR